MKNNIQKAAKIKTHQKDKPVGDEGQRQAQTGYDAFTANKCIKTIDDIQFYTHKAI